MKKKLEEKILAEIRNKVIERDFQRNTEKEIKEMREANIEALTELTSLSRGEVEKIADEVKKDYLIKAKAKQNRLILISVSSVIVLFILFLIFKPKPELKTRVVEDSFNDNSFEWTMLNTFVYNRYFKENQYFIENNNDGWCYWDAINMEFPKNCDIEIASSWMNGKFSSYGFGLHKSDTEYFAFTMRGDGAVSFGKVIEGKWVIDDAFKYNVGKSGKKQTNIQKVEIRDKNFNYYVNDNLVRTGLLDLNYSQISLYCCGVQDIAFDYVKITNTDSKKIVFFDDFSKPSNLWKPKKNYTCEAFFSGGKYLFNVNNSDNCHWSTSEKHEITNNCEIELTSTWLTGELASYGLMILNNDDDYYSCELQNNGNARLVEAQSGKYTYIQDYIKTSHQSNGKNAITQKVVLKDNKILYYVNDTLIKSHSSLLYYPCKLAIRACGKQSLAFENLKIKYYE